jgi:glyoxylase-like metal-dependent hydrolase (beta-lactamase superfamily II)
VYGAEAFARLYGTIGPIPAERIRAVDDDAVVHLGSRPLRFLHTRGHANHHVCMLDEHAGDVYTGDSFGLCYPALQKAGLFIFPSTSPTEFDADEARASIQRIVGTGASTAYPTHFGPVRPLDQAAAQLIARLDEAESILDAAIASDGPDDGLEAFCKARLEQAFDAAIAARGLHLSLDERSLLELDLRLNAQGLAWVAARRRGAAHA